MLAAPARARFIAESDQGRRQRMGTRSPMWSLFELFHKGNRSYSLLSVPLFLWNSYGAAFGGLSTRVIKLSSESVFTFLPWNLPLLAYLSYLM